MGIAASCLIIVLVVCLLAGVPIIWSLGLASMVSIILNPDLSLVVVAQRLFAGADSFSLLAVPAFMLAGDIMAKGGLSKRLVNLADSLVGWISGGISIVSIVACTFFAAISGSSVATTAAIGGLMYPEMVKRGYPEDYSAALQAIGGTLGIVIPPSVVFVIYGNVTGVSISKLLMSGVLSGLFCCLMLCVLAFVIAKKKKFPKEHSFSGKKVLKALKDSVFALLMPLIILGGIYAGIFTPTEAAAVAVLYGTIICVFVYREITTKELWRIMRGTVKSACNIMMLVAMAQVFAYLITYYDITNRIAYAVLGVCHTKIVFLLMINLLLIIAGMFLDNGSIILILGPILAPLAVQYGIDPVHFGLIVVFLLAMGQCTPPFGTCMFVSCGVANRPVGGVARQLMPFILVEILCGLIFSFVPAFSTLIPNML
ncbi:TRAP transporter large permease [Treponema socranskii]|uniref:TRAP transporter large permease n=1 Tax=Treponema socranskii TaxID=53419 RepID=UPI0028E45DF3|nr:TRAP transporter large permease [Treponema socranskii]